MSLKEIVLGVLSGHEFIGPDSFRLEQNDPCRECHFQISQYLQEMDRTNAYETNPKMSSMGETLLEHNYPNQVSLVIALFARLGNENSKHYYHRSFLSALLRPLLPRRLPYTETQLNKLLTFVASTRGLNVPLVSLLGNVQRYLESHPLSEDMRAALQTLKQSQNDFSDKKPINKIDEILGNTSRVQPKPGEAWTNTAISDLEQMTSEARAAWETLFAHALTADSAKPSAKWLAEATRHRQAVGEDNATQYIASWLKLVAPPPPFTATAPPYPDGFGHTGDEYRQYQLDNEAALEAYREAHTRYFTAISEKNIAILKGLTWYVIGSSDTDIALGLGHLVSAAFTSIRERGSWATRTGNAGIWALGQMPNGLGVGARWHDCGRSYGIAGR